MSSGCGYRYHNSATTEGIPHSPYMEGLVPVDCSMPGLCTCTNLHTCVSSNDTGYSILSDSNFVGQVFNLNDVHLLHCKIHYNCDPTT